ncbi:hypothetical protein Q9189_006428 [Teloschistes chrysophthalmus]
MHNGDTETTPLLGNKQPKPKRQLRSFLTENVAILYAPLPLLVCCFLTGLIDAGSYNAWSVFMGMQTGNTVFLALSSANLPAGSDSLKWARSGVSILSLMLGSLIAGRMYNAVGPTRRLTLIGSFLLQSLCIVIAAVLVQTNTVPERNATDKIVLVAIPFLAAQSGAQVATAKSLGFSELPTTVLTSVYNDLASDDKFLAWDNPKRDRRYTLELAKYKEQEESLTKPQESIYGSLGSPSHTSENSNWYTCDLLRALKQRTAPSDAPRALDSEGEYGRLKEGPKNQSIDAWLDEWHQSFGLCK